MGPAGLTSLDLSGCRGVSSESLECIRALPLRRLGLDGCPVTMTGVMGTLRTHRGVALWHTSRDRTPRWVLGWLAACASVAGRLSLQGFWCHSLPARVVSLQPQQTQGHQPAPVQVPERPACRGCGAA